MTASTFIKLISPVFFIVKPSFQSPLLLHNFSSRTNQQAHSNLYKRLEQAQKTPLIVAFSILGAIILISFIVWFILRRRAPAILENRKLETDELQQEKGYYTSSDSSNSSNTRESVLSVRISGESLGISIESAFLLAKDAYRYPSAPAVLPNSVVKKEKTETSLIARPQRWPSLNQKKSLSSCVVTPEELKFDFENA